jgi:hypothetical protein
LFKKYLTRIPKIHPEYDFSESVLISKKDKIKIKCKTHGFFFMRLDNVLDKRKCFKCSRKTAALKTKVKTTKSLNTFIEQANKKHNRFYSYNLSKYVNTDTKLTITCPIHGNFKQSPANHLKGQGCPKCGKLKLTTSRTKSLNKFIQESNVIHKNKYCYKNSVYKNTETKIVINCKIHGKFKQEPKSHIKGSGCPSCAKYGFSPNLEYYLYYIKIKNNYNSYFYKIGITKHKNILDRFTPKDKKRVQQILFIKHFKNGEEALKQEQKILKKFNKYLFKGIHILNTGNKEMFYKNVVLNYLNNNFDSDLNGLLDHES